jgi:hypothetical protein
MLKRTALKLLGGIVFLLFLFGLSRAFRYYSSYKADAEADELLQQACSHLRELSSKPLPTCESELTAERKALGGFYTRKLRCLKGLPNLDGYKQCSSVAHLQSFPE